MEQVILAFVDNDVVKDRLSGFLFADRPVFRFRFVGSYREQLGRLGIVPNAERP